MCYDYIGIADLCQPFSSMSFLSTWFLSGELMPLDLLPSPIREWVIALPFSCGIYIPAAYLSGRINTHAFMKGFLSLAVGGVVFGLLAQFVWKKGLRRYTGTGA